MLALGLILGVLLGAVGTVAYASATLVRDYNSEA